jgi:hypothetical protein
VSLRCPAVGDRVRWLYAELDDGRFWAGVVLEVDFGGGYTRCLVLWGDQGWADWNWSSNLLWTEEP